MLAPEPDERVIPGSDGALENDQAYGAKPDPGEAESGIVPPAAGRVTVEAPLTENGPSGSLMTSE